MAVQLDNNLTHDSQWEAAGFKDRLNENLEGYHKDYVTFLGWNGLIIQPYALFEAGIRNFVCTIEGNAKGYNPKTYEVLQCFYSKLNEWSFSLGNHVEFLNLYRETRNTMHNNGMHSPVKPQLEYHWRDKQHIFIPGENREFYMDDCIMLFEDLTQFNLETMSYVKNSKFLNGNINF